jgi:hypothetical protein
MQIYISKGSKSRGRRRAAAALSLVAALGVNFCVV